MKVEEFSIGDTFWHCGRKFLCTYVGTQAVIGIQICSTERVFDRGEVEDCAKEKEEHAEGASDRKR